MGQSDTAPFTVAIIDDDSSIRRLVKHMMRRSGYQVLEATTAQEALTRLKESPWDLAILDRRLPDEDGVSVCAKLKSDPDFRARYVIILTAETQQQDKIEGLELGADDYVTKPFQPAELMARIRAGKRIIDLQKELIASNKRLELLAITDGLTQLYNHRYFQDEFGRKFEEATRYERPLSLALLDIDFFKKINDTYGHAAGDQVLRTVAKIFSTSIRAADFAARYGGEEFAIMMPETSLEDAIQFAEKIRTAVESQTTQTDAGEVPTTLSIGVSSMPHTRIRSPREMIELADRALYRAKRSGRNQVQAERRHDVHRKTRRSA